MTLDNAIRIARERIALNELRQDDIDNPVRSEFIKETTEALQTLVDYANGEQHSQDGWVGALDRLPKDSGNYLTWYISEEYGEGEVIQYFNVISRSWGMTAMFGGQVNHWRILPGEPKGGKV